MPIHELAPHPDDVAGHAWECEDELIHWACVDDDDHALCGCDLSEGEFCEEINTSVCVVCDELEVCMVCGGPA